MELTEAIETRRSNRHFNSKQIAKSNIKEILQCGILSPSAHNRQPWNFYIIENQAKKEEIARLLARTSGDYTIKTCNVIRECSVLILVTSKIEDKIMDTLSVGACIENMLLKATDLGVASLWIGYILEINLELQKMFNTSQDIVSAIALGFSEKNPSPRPRKTLDECSFWC